MFRLALKRLLHNRSLSALLLLAAVLCVAALSSVPIYTRGVLQKLLRADLEGLQHAGATYPGRIHAELDFFHPAHGDDGFARYQAVDAAIERLAGDLGVPVLARTEQLTLGPVFFEPRGRPDARRLIKMEALTGLAGHVRITGGRLFGRAGSAALSEAPYEAPYEAIVTEHAVAQLDLRLGATYELDRPSPAGTELATLASRGAHARQLAKRTLVEAGLLAAAGLLVGLPAGLLFSRLLGASAAGGTRRSPRSVRDGGAAGRPRRAGRRVPRRRGRSLRARRSGSSDLRRRTDPASRPCDRTSLVAAAGAPDAGTRGA
ncbi:MAG: hypothetical protein OXC31_09625 [Spirochaetaceae bacterium]|nr:hypothetical protein [Spirochaetaceae bacterium]